MRDEHEHPPIRRFENLNDLALVITGGVLVTAEMYTKAGLGSMPEKMQDAAVNSLVKTVEQYIQAYIEQRFGYVTGTSMEEV